MTGSPATEVALELYSCKFRRVCQAPDDECLMNGLRCTDACCFQHCPSMRPEVDEQQEQHSSDDEV